jgi:hypothetical protein
MKLIADCLAIGSKRLTELTLSGVTFTPRGTTILLEFWPDSHNIESFLEWNLGHLQTLRGVHLHFDDTLPFRPNNATSLHRMMIMSGQPYQAVSRTFRRMERVKARFLEYLAEDMSKDT